MSVFYLELIVIFNHVENLFEVSNNFHKKHSDLVFMLNRIQATEAPVPKICHTYPAKMKLAHLYLTLRRFLKNI